MTAAFHDALERFRNEYGAHRASEGRAHSGAELLSLPYLKSGPLARQWAVRSCTFDALMRRVVRPTLHPLEILDLGAGNGWLSYRLAREGHRCIAVDIREDAVDGLGAAAELVRESHFDCCVASFDRLPQQSDAADLAVFNASLHYSVDLPATLAEAARVVRPGGRIAILDSPFYKRAADGEAMVAEKRAGAEAIFGDGSETLLALPFIEYLTRARLTGASAALGLRWRRLRVRYPLWYELRPLAAMLRRARAPSRFDLWVADVP